MTALVGPYCFLEPIGEGSFGRVWKCVHAFSGVEYACKIVHVPAIREDRRTFENFINEMRANSQICHPGIVRLFDVQCDSSNIFLFLELCPGGQLEDLVRKSNGLTEAQAQIYFRQLMQAIEYIHSQSFAHRDVTLKNILIARDGSAELTDFGLCKRRALSELCTTMCGTFVYVAPEMLQFAKYDAFKVDIWSAGICLYSMVTNHLPWIIEDSTAPDQIWSKTAEQICGGNILYEEGMSDDLKDLLGMMLSVNADERATATDVLGHPWMQEGEDPIGGSEPDAGLVSLVESVIQALTG
jgi:serine/threonine protein kinase